MLQEVYDCKSEEIGNRIYRFKAEIGTQLSPLSVGVQQTILAGHSSVRVDALLSTSLPALPLFQ